MREGGQRGLRCQRQTSLTPLHAFPSRMTIGMLWEMLWSRFGLVLGQSVDGTAFEEQHREADFESLVAALTRRGFTVKARCIDGITGRLMDGLVFMGPVFTSALKHLARFKIHARARGPINPTTRQPTDGKARDGGHRLGEMKRDCIVA